jgi:DNA repair protein RadC
MKQHNEDNTTLIPRNHTTPTNSSASHSNFDVCGYDVTLNDIEISPISRRHNPLRLRYISISDNEVHMCHKGHKQHIMQSRLITEDNEIEITNSVLLEIILGFTEQRDDANRLSNILISKLHTLSSVISADYARLKYQYKLNDNSLNLIKVMHVALKFILRERLNRNIRLESMGTIIDYMKLIFSRSDVEELHVFYLDSSNSIIIDEVFARGTINHAPLYPRELVRRALEVGAAGVIISHNHPSGDPKPSRADKKTTRELKEALELVGITLIDHIIIGHTTYVSFRRRGLLGDIKSA